MGTTARPEAVAARARAARPETARTRSVPVFRLVAGHAPQAPKTPFVLLVLGLLGGGLITLLLLSSASSADAFTQRKLEKDNRALSVREQELGRQVAASEAPGALTKRAQQLGLVQGALPGYLVVGRDGSVTVLGSPVPATSPAPPPTPSATPAGTRPSPGAAARPPGRSAPTPPGGSRPATPTPRSTATPAPGGDR